MREIYIEKRPCYTYPTAEFLYSPSEDYPEYPFDKKTISGKKNEVYDMIRSALYGMGLDKENYGTDKWNPLKDYISLGDMVLLKPNMVLHENHIKSNGTECLITHPSIVKAMLDFVIIALKGTGEIIIGDAPLQNCDFDRLIKENNYIKLIDFYKSKGIKIDLQDFRLFSSVTVNGQVSSVEYKAGDKYGYTTVDLGKNSYHELQKCDYNKLRVTNYNPNEMRKYHNDNIHQYQIPNSVIRADVVINLPKPKTHRKAGVTIALKNLIGINGNKDRLPHHTKGSIDKGGDEYLHQNVFKSITTYFQERCDINNIKGNYIKAKLFNFIRKSASFMAKATQNDKFTEGSWYGNDTLWRTIGDLNTALIYSDKKGVIQNTPQRKSFIVADMIISGEKEGPLLPSPKKVGVIAVGHNPLIFDTSIATIMGYDYKKIPSLYKICEYTKNNYFKIDQANIVLYSNNLHLNEKKLNDILKNETYSYCPPSGWKGHIEME